MAFVVLGLLITVPWILIRTLSRLLRRMDADLLSLGEVGIATTRAAASDVKNRSSSRPGPSISPRHSTSLRASCLGSLISTAEYVVKLKIPVFGARVASFVSGILCRISATIASGIDSAQEAASKAVPGKSAASLKPKPSKESAPEEDSGSRWTARSLVRIDRQQPADRGRCSSEGGARDAGPRATGQKRRRRLLRLFDGRVLDSHLVLVPVVRLLSSRPEHRTFLHPGWDAFLGCALLFALD